MSGFQNALLGENIQNSKEEFGGTLVPHILSYHTLKEKEAFSLVSSGGHSRDGTQK